MKKFIPSIFLFCLFFLGKTSLSAQDFIFTEIPNPPGLQFNSFVTQANGTTYLSYFSTGFYDNFLYTFDGETLTDIGGPADYTYSFFLTEQEGNLYMAYNDPSYYQALVRYDGTDFTVLGEPGYNEFLNGYVFSVNGFDYFSWFEFIGFTTILRYVDGDELVEVELPDGLTFNNFIGELNGEVFVALQDATFNVSMYSFDGTEFVEVGLPDNTTNPFTQLATDDELYINVFDAGFNSLLYIFDGSDFTLVETPTGFTLGGYYGQLDDRLYWTLNDVNFNATMHYLEGDTWTEVPVDASYQPVFGAGQSESALYPAFTDDGFYTFTLVVVDEDGAEVVENPLGYQYSFYQTDWEEEGGVFLRYFDEIFNPVLMYYDDVELLEVTPPDNLIYNNYAFDLDELLYFTFRDFNFNTRLFYLGEPNEAPFASDNTVNTLIETPFLFDVEDFNFADVDVDDTLAAIQIVDKPTLGILHLDGANIGTGDVIPADEITTLTYIPFNDGEGVPYDSFTFKVFDGDDFSEETYTMFINVTEVLNAKDNPLAVALEIYPNPARDFLRVEMKDYYPASEVEMIVYNQNGVAVERRFSNRPQETFDVNDWASGVYILVLTDGENMASRRVLVQ